MQLRRVAPAEEFPFWACRFKKNFLFKTEQHQVGNFLSRLAYENTMFCELAMLTTMYRCAEWPILCGTYGGGIS